MIESEQSPPPPDLGPPVLLKRLGNAVEANLAKAKLATAGIPSFLGGENVFAGDLMHPLPYREVELYVPQSMAHDALEVLDAPMIDEMAYEPIVDDPGRVLSFRAFVAAVVGWLAFFTPPIGFALGVVAFAYSGFLAACALRDSVERARSTVVKCAMALILSVAGLAAAVVVLLEFIPR